MRRLLFICFLVVLCSPLLAQDSVSFDFYDGISKIDVKKRMENNVSNLLSAINRAETAKSKKINFSGIGIDSAASQSIMMLWENIHFRTPKGENDFTERCLQMKSNTGKIIGYQVRNIPVEIKFINDSYKEDTLQEVCICFDSKGNVSDFNIAMEKNQYTRLYKEGQAIGDLDKRLQIIQLCEQFRNAYISKDTAFIRKILSDDALIITGRKIKSIRNSEIRNPYSYTYTIQKKEQYLNNLKSLFKRVKYVDVEFYDYSVCIHPAKPNYYGVTLKQKWTNLDDSQRKLYEDFGVVFIAWDFSNEDEPKIEVRTWQPLDTPTDQIISFKRLEME